MHSTTTAMPSMHDAWVEAAEKEHMAGVVMVDMFAAFDVVDTSILQDTLLQLRYSGVVKVTFVQLKAIGLSWW